MIFVYNDSLHNNCRPPSIKEIDWGRVRCEIIKAFVPESTVRSIHLENRCEKLRKEKCHILSRLFSSNVHLALMQSLSFCLLGKIFGRWPSARCLSPSLSFSVLLPLLAFRTVAISAIVVVLFFVFAGFRIRMAHHIEIQQYPVLASRNIVGGSMQNSRRRAHGGSFLVRNKRPQTAD